MSWVGFEDWIPAYARMTERRLTSKGPKGFGCITSRVIELLHEQVLDLLGDFRRLFDDVDGGFLQLFAA